MSSVVDYFAGAASDLFGSKGGKKKAAAARLEGDAIKIRAQAERTRAEGNRIEARNYGEAAQFSDLNAVLAFGISEVKLAQQARSAYQGISSLTANIGAAGFTEGGSAGDLLRSSNQQAAIEHGVLQEQGLIEESGFKEQARSYRTMQEASLKAAEAQELAATATDKSAEAAYMNASAIEDASKTSFLNAGLKVAAGVGKFYFSGL